MKKSFTLIELLVVVAIIAVLIAILLPALSEARAIAMQMSCAGRMKQMGLGMQMYLAENRDVFPPYAYVGQVDLFDKDGDGMDRLYWGNLLKMYVGDKTPNGGQDYSPCSDVFFCPTMGPAVTEYGYKFSTMYMGFAYNNYGLGGDMWHNYVRSSSVKFPDKILCFAEASQLAWWWPGSPIWSTNHFDDGARIQYRHRATTTQDMTADGYCNAFYVDGHVTSMKCGEIPSGWSYFHPAPKPPYMEEGW